MKVWWCQEHGWNGWPEKDICLWVQVGRNEGAYNTPCRMVPMRLVPDNEETVDREALLAAVQHLVEEFGPSREWPDGDPEWDDYQPLAVAARAWLALDGETP